MIIDKNYLLSYKSLIFQMVRRDILSRYRGSMLGVVWSFLTPLSMLLIYVLFFQVILKTRWSIGEGDTANFAVILFSGLVIHSIFADVLSRSPTAISSNPNYVKKIVFPLELLPFVGTITALVHGLISVMVLLLVILVTERSIPLSILWIPLILLPFVLFLFGMSWFLAAIGVFFRDINQITGPVITALLFLSPIFYPVSSLPHWMAGIIYLNPLTLIVQQMRVVLIFSDAPDFGALLLYSVLATAVMMSGLKFFIWVRKSFADVL